MWKLNKFRSWSTLVVGLSIAVSACGIENTAHRSSESESSGVRTKNAAIDSPWLNAEWCRNYGTYGIPADLDYPIDEGTSIRGWADRADARFQWAENGTRITDVYGVDIVKCNTIVAPAVPMPSEANEATDLSETFVAEATGSQCITVEDRKKTIHGYDEQIMAHSMDVDTTYFEQMKTGRWITTMQKPCTETLEPGGLYTLACVTISHRAFEEAFYNEQYELHKHEAGSNYLDAIIIGREKLSRLAAC